jgi:hypothetical protein
MNHRWIDLPRVIDDRGTLVFAEAERQIPFAVKRAYWLVDAPPAATRGGHAHVALEQCLLALKGSLTLDLSDGDERVSLRLESCSRMVYVGPGLWRELRDFTPDAACLVFASAYYDEADYIRDWETFLLRRKAHG